MAAPLFTLSCRALVTAAIIAIACPAVAEGPPAPGLHEALASWREIPVLEDGRIMPLDTFARRHVETITNVQAPRLATGPREAVVRWQADELLLDWLARPQAWEDVPFLIAEHEEVRKLLGLPVFETTGGEMRRLKYAAPSDVAESEPLRVRLVEIDERRRTARRVLAARQRISGRRVSAVGSRNEARSRCGHPRRQPANWRRDEH